LNEWSTAGVDVTRLMLPWVTSWKKRAASWWAFLSKNRKTMCGTIPMRQNVLLLQKRIY